MSALIIALQQGPVASGGNTSPPSGDTTGYWQQRVHYTIVATLDERAQKVRARGVMRYVNNSPDTLREMYLHQYLNAFRPGSRWSAVDEREGRERFQRLRDPDYGYERFTGPVRVDGAPATVNYPGAPDSTVAHLALPRLVPPGDSVTVAFEWDARPSTTPRRQGRRGRHWDLAQWYPKVAVYDRGGWEYNALQPAGEFYGEFGTYDVTLVLAQDQVIGATGVPVSGDPGWNRVLRNGAARPASAAYGDVPGAPAVAVGPGQKAVRFFARDVHHFAWSASPDYRYEGGIYARPVPGVRWPTWDTVSVHALYRIGDDTSWGGLKVVLRTQLALRWLESIYGPYAHPQMTVLHRLDGGGTEFPMMQMNGSPSQGLILHEGGHVFTYGILANNEWRSGWMDEGLTSFQTEWAQGFLPQERLRAAVVDVPARVTGYRARGIRMSLTRFDATGLDQFETDVRGDAQPIGTTAHEFRDFATYNDMIYTRAQVMYGQLRDVLGDSLFVEFLHDYYSRWALRHVDERAMRASAERVSRRDLGWFFDQWVHQTGIMDYGIARSTVARDPDGTWTTDVVVARRGEYRHPIQVGVRTSGGWTIARAARPELERETVRVTTREQPLDVQLDPLHFSWDWDRRNDVPGRSWVRGSRARWNFDWPFLVQADRDRNVATWRPMGWYSRGGGAAVGARVRTSYLGWLDHTEAGIAFSTRSGLTAQERVQLWARAENPTVRRRPLVGLRWGAAFLDDITKLDVGVHRRPGNGHGLSRDVALTWTTNRILAGDPSGTTRRLLTPELWDSESIDLAGQLRWQRGRSAASYSYVEPRVLIGWFRRGYGKGEIAVGRMHQISTDARVALRAYGGMVSGAVPLQRSLLLSARDPVSTFENHWWRPAGGILKQPGVNWLPLGGAALRGYRWDLAASRLAGGNVDASRRIGSTNTSANALGLWLHAFFDAAAVRGSAPLSDAGVGLSVRGRLYDQPIIVRLDAPMFVSQPAFAIDRGQAGAGRIAPRWALSFNDIW